MNLHMKFCLQFQKGHKFSHRIRLAIYTLTLVTSGPPRGEVIIYMLIIPKSLSLAQISLLGCCSQLSRCTRTLHRYARLKLSKVETRLIYPFILYFSS